MSVILVGIALGLAAAFLQSLCYIVSGSYVRRTGMPGWTLTAPQRAAMLVPYAVLTWLVRPDSLDGVGSAALAGALVVTFAAYCGDVGLFQMQKTVEPSRVAPLQAMKIPLIAVLSFLALGHAYSVGQVAGIALVLASAAVLFGAGRRIGPFACFSLSGVVLGTIAQSTRGLISVAFGWFLVRHGFADLERETSVSAFIRRAAAAVLIVLAMALYIVG